MDFDIRDVDIRKIVSVLNRPAFKICQQLLTTVETINLAQHFTTSNNYTFFFSFACSLTLTKAKLGKGYVRVRVRTYFYQNRYLGF